MTEEHPETTTRLRILTRFVLTDRRRIVLLTVSFVFDVLFTIAVAIGAIHLHTVSQQAAIEACQSGNRFRAADRQLWEHVLSITSPAHPSSQEAKTLHNFQLYLNGVMAPRVCTGL